MAEQFTADEHGRRLVQAVRQHALSNYETGGWDYVVEAMSDDDILCDIMNAQGDFEGTASLLDLTEADAIKAMGAVCKLLDDRRRDIRATAF